MFLSRNKTNNVYPYKPQFYYIKVGFKGVKHIYVGFRDAELDCAPGLEFHFRIYNTRPVHCIHNHSMPIAEGNDLQMS